MMTGYIKTACIMLVLLVLLPGILACPGPVTKPPAEIPVVTLKRVAPTEFIFPGEEVCSLATPEEGGLVVNNAARVWVPPEAVAGDTPVSITLFTGEIPGIESANPDAPELMAMSGLYDIGPDNASFSKPVEITIAYDDKKVPKGARES